MNYTMLLVITSTTLLAIASGILGTFIILQKRSLFADVISHAALAGITSIFLITRQSSSATLLAGAVASSALATYCLRYLVRNTRLKQDTALSIILSVFFGLGLVLMTFIQKMGISSHVLLYTFLLGNVSTLLVHDLYLIGAIALLVIIVCAVLWKEFTLLTFDSVYAAQLMSAQTVQGIITTLMLITIIAGIQLVGVILMSALLIAPAATARQFTYRLGSMALFSIGCACCATNCGVLLSSYIPQIPTGPAIVVIVCCNALLSLLYTKR